MDTLVAMEQLRRTLQIFANTLSDEKALEVPSVFPEWTVGTSYSTGDIVRYNTNSLGDPQLYKVVQNHVSQADWTPDATPSLYDAFGLDESGYPLWSQPSGAHDAYGIGDIVNYNSTLYESIIDGNVWSPDVYPAGWKLYEESEEGEDIKPTPDPGEDGDTGETETYPEFVQPTGGHDAYHIGDRVTYNGKAYESIIDNNVWSPTDYPAGWKEI